MCYINIEYVIGCKQLTEERIKEEKEGKIMLVQTRYFGEIDLSEDKILTFEQGLMGFEGLTKFTLLYDSENEDSDNIMWFQSLEEPGLALPVINPLYIKKDYNPEINDEYLEPLGEIEDENLCVLITLTVPEDIKRTTANLKAPLIINASNRKGLQIIVENQDYEIRYNIYDTVQKMKEEKGECKC